MDSGDGVLDVIELNGDTVQALARLFTGPPIFTGLLGRFVNLEALLEYLSEEQLDGSVIVNGASEVGVILMQQGAVLGAYTESQPTWDKATTAVAALAAERDGFIRQGFRRFVAHTELLKAQKSLMRHLSRFFA